MNNRKKKNSFFGLFSSEKTRIIKEATDKAIAEQLKLLRNMGGKTLKNYSR